MHLVIYYASDATSNWTRAAIIKWWNKLWIKLLSLSQLRLRACTPSAASVCVWLLFDSHLNQVKFHQVRRFVFHPQSFYIRFCLLWCYATAEGVKSFFKRLRRSLCRPAESTQHLLFIIVSAELFWLGRSAFNSQVAQPRQLVAAGELIISTSWGIDKASYLCGGDKLSLARHLTVWILSRAYISPDRWRLKS